MRPLISTRGFIEPLAKSAAPAGALNPLGRRPQLIRIAAALIIIVIQSFFLTGMGCKRGWIHIEYPLPGFRTPCVAGGRVFLTALGTQARWCNDVWALSASSGQLEWTAKFKEPVPHAPAICGDVAVVHHGAFVSGLRAADGQVLWEKDVGGEPCEGPIAAGNAVVISTRVYEYEERKDNARERGPFRRYRIGESWLIGIDAATGQLLWEQDGVAGLCSSGTIVLAYRDYRWEWDEREAVVSFSAVEVSTGAIVWSKQYPGWNGVDTGPYGQPAFGPSGDVAVQVTDLRGHRRIPSLNQANGEPKYILQVDEGASYAACGPIGGRNSLFAFEHPERVDPPPIRQYDLGTGKMTSEVRGTGVPRDLCPLGAWDGVLLGSWPPLYSSYYYGISLDTGEIIWVRELGNGYAFASIQDGFAYIGTLDGGYLLAICLDVATGDILWRYSVTVPPCTGPPGTPMAIFSAG